jgi:outer membrane lipoprotein-sorting protein
MGVSLFNIFSCCAFVLTSFLRVHAQEFKRVDHPEPIFAALKANSEKVHTISADFAEVRYASYLKEPLKSSGQFFYQKKEQMRWEQQKPSSYIILINGNSLRISEQGKEKNIKSAGNMAGMIRETLLMMVSGDFQASKSFEKTVSHHAGNYLVTLTPLERRLKQRYDRLELLFSKSTLGLKQLTFFEKAGDKQVMTFSNEKVNASLAPTIFTQF